MNLLTIFIFSFILPLITCLRTHTTRLSFKTTLNPDISKKLKSSLEDDSLFDSTIIDEPLSNALISNIDTNIDLKGKGGGNHLTKFKQNIKSLDKLFLSKSFDPMNAANLHEQIILNLVESNIQKRQYDEPVQSIPECYVVALEWIEKMITNMRKSDDKAVSIIRMIQKKDGLTSIHRRGRPLVNDLTSREVVEIKRKTERSLSQILTFLITLKQSRIPKAPIHIEKDLIYFSKTIIEKTQVHDRHFALLYFCRALLYSLQSSPNSFTTFNDLSSFSLVNSGSLMESFKEGMKAQGEGQPSVNARLAFPFILIPYRAYRFIMDYPFQNDDSKSLNIHDAFLPYDNEVCSLLSQLLQLDRQQQQQSGLKGVSDDMIGSIKRWVCEDASLYFINAEPALASPTSGIAECIRRNTVAMELICTRRTLKDGKKRHRENLLVGAASTGRVVELLMHLADQEKLQQEVLPVDNVEDITAQAYSISPLLMNFRRVLAIISALRNLPDTHKLKRRAHQLLGLHQIKAGQLRKQQALLQQVRRNDPDPELFADESGIGGILDVTGVGGAGKGMDSDPELYWESRGEASGNRIRGKVDELDDESLFKPSKLLNEVAKKRQGEKVSIVGRGGSNDQDSDRQTVDLLQTLLLELIAVTLNTHPKEVLGSPTVRQEVLAIFSTWRRPQLLLDYHRMHRSSPDLQQLHARFLRALFGISDETIDDIRYNDPGNLLHFNRIPSNVRDIWIKEGLRSKGDTGRWQQLPGYADAQTLFMIGEDSGTCMSIRARQKGTNRGLLSFVLHGNVRVLGLKDQSGRLSARAVARLLIDDATGQPVLFVDATYGTNDNSEASLINAATVCDEAAEIGTMLNIPVIYSCPLPDSNYAMSGSEHPAVMWKVENDGSQKQNDNDSRNETAGLMKDQIVDCMDEYENVSDFDSSDTLTEKLVPNVNISDFTNLATHIWVDGVRLPSTSLDASRPRFVKGFNPLLSRRRRSSARVVYGLRPLDVLENMFREGLIPAHNLPPGVLAPEIDPLVTSDANGLTDVVIGDVAVENNSQMDVTSPITTEDLGNKGGIDSIKSRSRLDDLWSRRKEVMSRPISNDASIDSDNGTTSAADSLGSTKEIDTMGTGDDDDDDLFGEVIERPGQVKLGVLKVVDDDENDRPEYQPKEEATIGIDVEEAMEILKREKEKLKTIQQVSKDHTDIPKSTPVPSTTVIPHSTASDDDDLFD